MRFPTPNVRDWKGPPGAGTIARGGRQSSLPARSGTLPTPTAHLAKEYASPAEFTLNTPTLTASVLGPSSGGSLHPRFVEWMMGFPLGFTDLDGDDP
jgi:hypothetical protein